MSKRKVRFQKPERIFTPEEVLQEIKDYEEKYANSGPRRTVGKKKAENAEPWWKGHSGEFYGFEYNYQFLKLDCGWVEGHEMICEYCVQSLVNNYGTEAERIAFNRVNNLGKKYNCWITNKEYAKMRKSGLRRKRMNRRDLERYLREERRGIKPVFVEA